MIVGSPEWRQHWADWWAARAVRQFERGDELESWFSLLMTEWWKHR